MSLPFISGRGNRGGSFAAGPAAPAADTGVTQQDNLVVWYKMDENTGTAVADSSGNDFDASMQNMDSADWVTGKNGYALAFDGSDDYVVDGGSNYDVATAMNGHATDNSLQGAFSISFWLILPAGANSGIISIGSSATDGDSWGLAFGRHSGDTVRVGFGYMNGSPWYAYTDYWTADTDWHNIVCTFSGTVWKVYRNATLDNTTTRGFRRPMTNYGEKLHFGRAWSDASVKSMDDFRIYDIALDADDVAAIYNSGDGDW